MSALPEALAAVARAPHEPMELELIVLDDPRPDEVLVEIRAAGVCQTDLSARDQHIPIRLPAVLGHEGAGIVSAVGSDVSTVKVGDRVVMSQAFCGMCEQCTAGRVTACRRAAALSLSGVRTDGSALIRDQFGRTVSGGFLGQSSLATYALVREPNVVVLPDDVSWEVAAPLACGVQTGGGAILHTLTPAPSDSIVVFGAGTVGLSAIMATAYLGCRTIIVADPRARRLELAKALGATHVVDPLSGDAAARIQDLTGGGADFAVEASGAIRAGPAAVASLGPQGTCVLLGAPPFGTKIELDWIGLVSGRTVLGAPYGGGSPAATISMLLEMRSADALPLEKLVRTYALTDIARAIDDMESGVVLKPVLLVP